MQPGDLVRTAVGTIGVILEVRHPNCDNRDYRAPVQCLVHFGDRFFQGGLDRDGWYYNNEIKVISDRQTT